MKMGIDWGSIEAKWRAKWSRDGDFEANPNEQKKKFITVAYPYPNSPQHIGHGRTYTIADVHARFYRMKGYNVLFPMGFHYTGTPILGMAKRVQSHDAELLKVLRNIYHVPEDVIKTFVDPVRIADYFHEEIKAGMIEMGYSIDWRREFTTITAAYQRFIEWQIGTLREKELIIQGSHPVGWCPQDQNPVSQHDTLGDVEPDFTEYILVKFQLEDYVIPTATLRPETIFGVTNIWINPDVTYQKVTVDGEKWIVSKQCARKLEFLVKAITYDGDVAGSELVGQHVIVPHNKKSIPLLEASFVAPETGTGIVMSVPAHAPFDYQALADLHGKPDNTASRIMPVQIISTPGYGKIAAKEMCEKFQIKHQDDPRLEDATTELYNKEFYGGILNDNCGEFAGKKVSDAKDEIKKWLSVNDYSGVLLELTNAPVRCRCGAECVVKILSDQWFLNYGDASWKQKADACLDGMSILPPDMIGEFHHVVDWLRERACARQHGLGTKLPWDKNWIVESLSDSVIYMAYYTISRFVNEGLVCAQDMSEEFFDYVFLGHGKPENVAIKSDVLQKIRDEFLYFYPVDSRHSGRDLVPNHLTFFVLNHVAIFDRDHWPLQIVVNGSVLMDGKKMSKSMGNIIPLRKAIRDYGADPIRLAILLSAELLQDADFNQESISSIQIKLEAILRRCSELSSGQTDITEAEDRWIQSRLHSMIASVTSSVEKMRLREALHEILFEFEDDIQWYAKRAGIKGRENPHMLHSIYSARVAMLSPFIPYIAEEMWSNLGNSGMVSRSDWPVSDDARIDDGAIQSEHLLKSAIDDVAKILKVTKITPKKIMIYTADSSKSGVYRAVLKLVSSGKTQMGQVMKALLADPGTTHIKSNPDFVQKTIRDILSEPTAIRDARLRMSSFSEKEFLSSEFTSVARVEFGVQVLVFSQDEQNLYDPQKKARHARPFKPAIFVE